jgi:hypothetical protein
MYFFWGSCASYIIDPTVDAISTIERRECVEIPLWSKWCHCYCVLVVVYSVCCLLWSPFADVCRFVDFSSMCVVAVVLFLLVPFPLPLHKPTLTYIHDCPPLLSFMSCMCRPLVGRSPYLLHISLLTLCVNLPGFFIH